MPNSLMTLGTAVVVIGVDLAPYRTITAHGNGGDGGHAGDHIGHLDDVVQMAIEHLHHIGGHALGSHDALPGTYVHVFVA